MPRQKRRLTSKLIAFIAVMCAVANVLGFFTIPLGITTIHLMQLPIILTGLALGARAGGLVGLIGAAVMAFRLPFPSPNKFIIMPGNGILGFMTGLIYSRLRKRKAKPIIPQVISVIGAYLVQFPYVYLTDVYLLSLPSAWVLTGILPKLLLEDIISVFIAHLILFRVEIAEILQ